MHVHCMPYNDLNTNRSMSRGKNIPSCPGGEYVITRGYVSGSNTRYVHGVREMSRPWGSICNMLFDSVLLLVSQATPFSVYFRFALSV